MRINRDRYLHQLKAARGNGQKWMLRPEIAGRGRSWTISTFFVMECEEFATFANGTASFMQK